MIDHNTVQKILDAADIVEVVSDFVSLKRRGANYIGLCPFHNEKTPSFSVSRAKGICKCFSCGKGGSAVNFIMEHEQLSYYEALKYLAKKYHIEVKERELTPEEVEAQSEREVMLSINEQALKHFEDKLFNTEDGRNIGLSYFYNRGMTDLSIKKFHLGYSLDEKDALYKDLVTAGYNPKYIFTETGVGLCTKSNYNDGGFDRFKGRVMFPVFNIAGKIVAFGGRTLKNDHAKYVNSPESLIYKKSNELYGLFQAKQAISKNDKCYLVEGYFDVISMHQAGIENVVASSGTSLTEGQIRMIHRFTENITVLYDGDSAGIKASLRGIDMLLAEGLNIKVLLLPDGEDPDSFSRGRSSSELMDYIKENETDFISFKTKILLEGSENDPIKKSAVINDIIKSIAVIPSEISRAIYAQECSNSLKIDEKVLLRGIASAILENKKKDFEKREKEQREHQIEEIHATEVPVPEVPVNQPVQPAGAAIDKTMQIYEDELIRIVIKYGMAEFKNPNSNEESLPTVLEYIVNEMSHDGLQFSNPDYLHVMKAAGDLIQQFYADLNTQMESLEQFRITETKKGIEEISKTIKDFNDIGQREFELKKNIDNQIYEKLESYRCKYLAEIFCSSEDDIIRKVSTKYVSNRHILSKIYNVVSEYDRLFDLVPQALNIWKNGIVSQNINEIQNRLKEKNLTKEEINDLMTELMRLNTVRTQFSSVLGERVILPKK